MTTWGEYITRIAATKGEGGSKWAIGFTEFVVAMGGTMEDKIPPPFEYVLSQTEKGLEIDMKEFERLREAHVKTMPYKMGNS